VYPAKKRRQTAIEQAAAYRSYFGDAPPKALVASDAFARVSGLYPSLLAVHGGDLTLLHDDIVSLHFYLRWGSTGCPTFQLTHTLAAALLLTDCRKVCGRDVRMPFPSFEVLLPDGFLTYDGPTGVLPATHLIYHEYGVTPDEARGEGTNQIISRVSRGELPHTYLEQQPATYVAVHCLRSAVGLHRSLQSMTDDESVERFLFAQTTKTETTRLEGTLEYSTLDTAAIRGALRLLVNLSLYLRDLQDQRRWDPRPPRRASTPRSRAPSSSSPLFWTLGHEIKLDRPLLDAARVRAEGERTTWRATSRYTVRGHWKRTPCGERGRERRLVFVQPYWRGPLDGTQLFRQYTTASH
jgi:hypothetical protein